MKNIFTQHPHSIGETYFQHMFFALRFSGGMFLCSVACLLHAFFPFIFQKTASNYIWKTVKYFIERMPTIEQKVLDISHYIEKKKIKVNQK